MNKEINSNAYKNNRIKSKILVSWVLVIAWAYVIFYLSSRTAPESTIQSQTVISSFAGIFGKVITDPEIMTNIDGIVRETAHGVEYFILVVLVYNAISVCLNYRRQEEKLLTAETGIECGDKLRWVSCGVCSLLVCTLYALSDEIHQINVPGRAFQVMDLVIDVVGITIGVLVAILVEKLLLNKH